MGETARPQSSAIERLAAWTLAVRAEALPPQSLERAKLLLLDTLGCGFAALGDDVARAVLTTIAAFGEKPQCTVLGQARKLSPPSAVLANGTLIRVLDLNDYIIGADERSGARGGHPSDNIPVAVAAAELGRAGGRELLAAIVLGYEIYGRGKALMPADSVWDGISISGLVAPAIAGRLIALRQDQIADAIALSVMRAPTPVAVREGGISAAKSIANALIAQSGMQAALLAAQDVTGPLDLFEAERGLKSVFAHGIGTAGDIFSAPLATDGLIARVGIKAYPCFAGGQSAIAAALAMHRLLDGDVGRIAGIRVALADLPIVKRQIVDPGRVDPRSREAADHSLQFLIAVTLIDGTFGMRQFDNARWHDAEVRALMARLVMTTDPDLTRRAGAAYPCALHVSGRDGRPYEAEVLAPPGVSPDGLDAKTVLEKFHRVSAEHLAANARDRIVEAVMGLDSAPTCDELMQALVPNMRHAGDAR